MTGGRAPAAAKLSADVTLLDVVMLGAGAAIGSSIFSVLGPSARIAGTMLAWAIVLAVIPMAILGLVYAFMASAAPRSGASYAWPLEFIGPRFAFAIAWLRIAGSIGMLVTGALLLTDYLNVLTPLPPTPTMLAIIAITYALNVRGLSFAAKAQTIMMALLVVVFALFVATGVPAIRPDRLRPMLGASAVVPALLALPLLINLFQGIETATEIGDEVRDAKRTIPLGIIGAVLLTLAIYLSVTLVAAGLIGVEGIAASDAPLTTAASAAGNPLMLPSILGAAVLCLVKSMNVNFMIFSRNLYALGRSGMLPAAFARVHPRWGTPAFAATVVFLLTCAGLLLPRDLAYLLIATSIPTLLKYLSSCLCAIVVRRTRPDLVAQARFRVPRRLLYALAGAGALSAGGIALAGIATDWRPYVLLAGWGAVGVCYWFWRRRVDPRTMFAPAD